MTALSAVELDALDRKATEAFPGLLVRKDLLRVLRSAYGVPTFVIEFLLGKYAASADPAVIEQGMDFVRRNLSQKYVKPDEREVVKARIQQEGTYQIIDKVSVVLKEVDDKYWATLHNINQDYVNIDEGLIRAHDRLLMGGIWAEVKLRYDASLKFKNQFRPFVIDDIKPIQLSTRTIGPVIEARAAFTRDEWIDLLLRSLGLEPSLDYFTPRRKLLYLARLIPLVERNYNLIELGPRGTGKSFVYQQISPYSHLISGGQTTVAQMFVNLASGQRGLVCALGHGRVRRSSGRPVPRQERHQHHEELHGGRHLQPGEGDHHGGGIDRLRRQPRWRHRDDHPDLQPLLPDAQGDGYGFLRPDPRLPSGWEFGKTRDDLYTTHFGFVSDYLAEVLHHLRKTQYMDVAERYLTFGSTSADGTPRPRARR